MRLIKKKRAKTCFNNLLPREKENFSHHATFKVRARSSQFSLNRRANMLRLIIPLTIFVCIFALPRELQKRDVDKIAFPDEVAATTSSPKVATNEVADSETPKGNGTDLDNRFLGVGLGLGLALGNKLLGGHHGGGGYYPHHGGGGYYPHHGGGGKF